MRKHLPDDTYIGVLPKSHKQCESKSHSKKFIDLLNLLPMPFRYCYIYNRYKKSMSIGRVWVPSINHSLFLKCKATIIDRDQEW